MTYQRKINLWINTYVYIDICMYTFASEYFLYWNLTDSLRERLQYLMLFYFGPKLLKFLCSENNDISKLKVQTHFIYRVFYKYCVFSLKCFDFSELWHFCCSAAGVWPAIVYTHWHWERPESGIYFKIFKNTIFNEHPVQEKLWFFWTLPALLQRWFSTCLVCSHTLTPR